MIGKKIKIIADSLPLTARELAKEMEISTATLYGIYKREDVDTKYLKRFCEIASIDISEITGFSIESKTETLSVLEKQNEELKSRNNFLSKELAEAKNKIKELEAKFDKLNDALYKKFLGVELGKREASSKKATLLKEDLNLFALNFQP